jgi:hypothetical protein
MSGYTTLTFADTEVRRDPETGPEWLPLRHRLGVTAFGINAWRAPEAGGALIERHSEAEEGDIQAHQEVYVVVSGAARFTVGDDEFPAPAGTVVFVEDPALERAAVATAPDTLVLAIGAEPGKPFVVSPWEVRALGPY